MKPIMTSIALAGSLMAGTCLAAEAPACDLKAEIAAVQAAHKQAKAAGGEWRDTGKLVAKAEAAAAAGDCAKATGLYTKAKGQYDMGHEQALSQANAGNPAYLSK
jgi:hypothetical protein